MASKQPFKTTFDVDHVIRPIYTGGSVALDNGARLLATTLGEDAVLTDPATGKHLGMIEGVSYMDSSWGDNSRLTFVGWGDDFYFDLYAHTVRTFT